MRFLLKLMAVSAALFSGHVAMAGETCRSVMHLGQPYTVCSFDPARSEIRLYHSNYAGRPYGSFRAMLDDVAVDRTTVHFAMNAGMYHDDLSPVGLYVENGIERQKVSTKAGWGNFHLLPNGIFYADGQKAGVMETTAYLATGMKPWYATQSGPMLVIDGKIHPRFIPDSDSLHIRNGIGVDGKGIVHTVVSERAVRFYDLALLFRDELGCATALFFDGTISSLYVPEMKRHDGLFPVGPIFAVVTSRPG